MVCARLGGGVYRAEPDTLTGQSTQHTAIPTSPGTPTSNPASGYTNGSASPSSAKGSPPTSAATQTSNPSSEKSNVLMIPFPLHIANVRFAAAKKAALSLPTSPPFVAGIFNFPPV